jgi:uncharacterized protein
MLKIRAAAALTIAIVLAAGAGVAVAQEWKSQLSKPTFAVHQDVDVKVGMRDGVTLSADLYLPVGGEGARYSTVLLRTPYDNNAESNVYDGLYFAMRGYAVVVQDTRGRYDSGGDWFPARNEAKDGYDTIEWIAKQPWSDGKVGMVGSSYLGIVQLLAATETPPHLVCVFPRVAYSDQYKQWTYTGGAFALGLNQLWGGLAHSTRTRQVQYVNMFTPGFTASQTGMLREQYWHLPVIEGANTMGWDPVHYREWLKHPAYDDWWREVSIEDKYDRIAVPAYLVDAWFDLYNQGAPLNFNGIRTKGKTEAARKGTRLLMGPWIHSLGNLGTETKVGDVDFGPNSLFPIQETELRWFDYWLKSIQNGIDREPPVRIFVMGENAWRDEQEWPLARTQYTKYYLHSAGKANSLFGDGTLTTEAPGSEPPDTYTYDPRYPVPTLGGHTCCSEATVPMGMGPRDNKAAEVRADVLVYTTPVLAEDVEVTGPVRAKLFASSSARDTDWTVKLVDVYPGPDAKAINVADGILRARYREGLDRPKLMEPGTVYEFEVDLLNTSNVFKKGHRIRVEIASSNFPQYDRNQNTGNDLFTDTELKSADQTIHHAAPRPSHIVLPIIARPRVTSEQ